MFQPAASSLIGGRTMGVGVGVVPVIKSSDFILEIMINARQVKFVLPPTIFCTYGVTYTENMSQISIPAYNYQPSPTGNLNC